MVREPLISAPISGFKRDFFCRYCDDSTGGDGGRGSCLGDLYSIAFMENMDVTDLSSETLLAQVPFYASPAS
jgi:hypothetical protein